MTKKLTYREAAKRVHRSVLTIKRWRRRGQLEMGWDVRSGQRVRVVEERVLLACWRERMIADPIRQKRRQADRMRAAPNQVVEHLPGPDPESN